MSSVCQQALLLRLLNKSCSLCYSGHLYFHKSLVIIYQFLNGAYVESDVYFIYYI